jgi:hypothetical protein
MYGGIYMTKMLVQGFGWGDIVLVRDWYTQAVVGHDAGIRCTSQPCLEALDRAVTG